MKVLGPVATSRVGLCSARANGSSYASCGTRRPGHLGWGRFVPGLPCPACGHVSSEVALVDPAPGSVDYAQNPTGVRHSYLDATGTVTVMVDRETVETLDVRSGQGRAELVRARLNPDHVLSVLAEALPNEESVA